MLPKIPKPLNSKGLQPSSAAGNKALETYKNFKGEHSVVVGLSGGVDSSLTAALLVEAGWKVEGLTLWLMSGKGACCSEGLVDAAGICEQLGITHHIVDSRKLFQEKIIKSVIDGYQEGITPLPCSLCNRAVKFAEMLKWAEKERQINKIATGHYARVKNSNEELPTSFSNLPGNSLGRNILQRGLDANKDQSYFLYDLSQEILNKIIFPLGLLNKSDTREEAQRYGLRTATKKESQDLCLVDHHGSMKEFLDTYLPPRDGEITLNDGTIIGKHDGIEHFTIGQRKGLGISWKEPLHVVKIDPSMNRIIVAPRSDSGKSECIVGSVNWISIAPIKETISVEVQVRYRSKPVNAKLTPLKATEKDLANKRPYRCKLVFEEEQFSITPGQAAVFYSGDVVLGGGLIDKI